MSQFPTDQNESRMSDRPALPEQGPKQRPTHRHASDARVLDFHAQHLGLNLEQLARGLGYPADLEGRRNMPAKVRAPAGAMLERGLALIEPRAVWRELSVVVDPQRDTLKCGAPAATYLSVGRLVRTQLGETESLAAFVVTLGSTLERTARALMNEGQLLEGYLLDTVGSIAAEAATDLVEEAIALSVAPRGLRTTNRFSPGYCTWETSGQADLFDLLPPRPAGIRLSDTSMMSPIKSVSGIIGLGARVERRPYNCEFCGLRTCHQRLAEASI